MSTVGSALPAAVRAGKLHRFCRPAAAVQRLETMKGSSVRAVLVCVYGNRAYEDTLVELEDAAKQAGFRIIAAVAAIAEHSIVRRYAAGRPDAEDAKQLQAFAGKIGEKLSAGDDTQPETVSYTHLTLPTKA